VLSGYLVFKDVLDFVPTATVAVVGSISGLSVSYLFGRTSGGYLIRNYGHWLSITEAKVDRVQHWFQHLGRWTLIIGPFIPGVRNLMGYVAGASKLQLHIFARFAYLGAFISSVSFIGFGYLLGRHGHLTYSRPGLVGVMMAGGLLIYTAIPFWKRIRNWGGSLRAPKIADPS